MSSLVCLLLAATGVVSFKDAAKIKSWDAWNDHKAKVAVTNILQKENWSPVWRALNRLDPGLPEIGRLTTRTSPEVVSSKWSVGCETMDRDYAVWDNFKELVPMLGVKRARFFSGWAKTEQEKGVYDFTWLDPQIRECAEMGVKPWVCISYGNPVWGSDFRLGMRVRQVTDDPEALEAWLRYVKALVGRYKDIVDEWEIWNEPFGQAAEYAELFLRTARAVREVQPGATCICTAISWNDDPARCDYVTVLERLKRENALDLASLFVYHPYHPLPESSYATMAEPLRRLVKSYDARFDILQGETGCPSQLEFEHAMHHREWTECSQAKWNLRRAVGDAVRGIPSSVFTMIDLQYTFMLQSFGLVRSNALKEFVYRRPSWYAMRNVYAIFDDETKPVGISAGRESDGRELSQATFVRHGQTLRLFWFSDQVPSDARTFDRVTLDLPAGKYVWVDMITGRAFRLASSEAVPMWDSPVLIAPEGSVPLDAAPDKSARAFRPPAVPLVSVDPYFSLWSAADRLYDADTTFWTGKHQPLSVILTADGVDYRLCGRTDGLEMPTLEQKSVDVGATVTRYRFAGANGLQAEVEFATPRLTDDLEVFSRPVTYLTVRVSGAKAHRVTATLSGAFATNDDDAEMVWTTNTVAGLRDISVGRREQTAFSQSGDRQRPNWGFAHLVGPIAESDETVFLLAYDSVESVRFFGTPCVDWWRRGGKAFEEMLREAVRDYPSLAEKCRAFDRAFSDDMRRVGGPDYADIANLAWRQSFGACKFVAGPGREPMFLSNENGSGGMIGTTDVFYPQLPHLLLSSLTLAKASLAPTCIYAASTNWPYAYAPHDLGRFPIAEGQYYGMKAGQSVGGGTDDTYRMPVEECGNMLLCLAAVTKAEGHAGFVSRWWDEVSGWAAYLEKFGFDPGNQLCTDDFAGHLAHNANLSVKSILALAAYGQMAEMRGERETAARYRTLAAGMVPQWLEAAKGGARGGYRIAFDRPDTWSLKYNLVWDRLLGLNLFPPSVAEAELRAYRAAEQPYGVPLDCRKSYTKADWLIWCGALTGRREDLAFMAGGVRRFLNGSPDRIPFSDWYFADSGLYRGFIARSVVGGVFLPVLQHPDLVEKYRK